MSESFCILYQDAQRQPAKRLSMAYGSLESALSAAYDIAQLQFEPIEIRGTEGTLIGKRELEKAIMVPAS
jgi:hypothetical protein